MGLQKVGLTTEQLTLSCSWCVVTFTDYSGIGFTDSEGGYESIPGQSKGMWLLFASLGIRG